MVGVVWIVGFVILMGVGAVVSVYWTEIVDWTQEQIEKSPHQIERKWKKRYSTTIEYSWRCTCGREDWSTSKSMAYSYFVNHRILKRKQDKIDNEIKETEGW